MVKRLLVIVFLAFPAPSQNAPVLFAGERLQPGMNQDAVLGLFAANPRVEVIEAASDKVRGVYLYAVGTKNTQIDPWEQVGNLMFQSGKLTMIEIIHLSSPPQKDAVSLARAIYTAIAGDKPLDVSTAFNGDASHPVYEIHLVFKDREVVISSASIPSYHSQGVLVPSYDTAEIATYYPREVIKVQRK